MKSYVGEDGRWRHRLRQSWLKTADLCPEQARLDHDKKLPESETDAANIGTAVHAVIEGLLADKTTQHSLADTIGYFDIAWEAQQVQTPNMKWVKYSPKSATNFGRTCTAHWHRQVYPTLFGMEARLEAPFLVPFIDDDARVVELSGTIDFVGGPDHNAPLKDWKTSGRGEYTAWEKKRWDVQSMVYTYAANHLGWIELEPDDTTNFEFVVMHEDGVQRLPVTRGPEHWSWLQAKVEGLCLLIEAQLPVWPKQDNHALCSPKWCPAWDFCKGAHLVSGM